MNWEPNNDLKISKEDFLAKLADLYRIGNVADHETNPNAWAVPSMAGDACCNPIDRMLDNMRKRGVLTAEEQQAFYDNL
jgi:hypothetical protein